MQNESCQHDNQRSVDEVPVLGTTQDPSKRTDAPANGQKIGHSKPPGEMTSRLSTFKMQPPPRHIRPFPVPIPKLRVEGGEASPYHSSWLNETVTKSLAPALPSCRAEPSLPTAGNRIPGVTCQNVASLANPTAYPQSMLFGGSAPFVTPPAQP